MLSEEERRQFASRNERIGKVLKANEYIAKKFGFRRKYFSVKISETELTDFICCCVSFGVHPQRLFRMIVEDMLNNEPKIAEYIKERVKFEKKFRRNKFVLSHPDILRMLDEIETGEKNRLEEIERKKEEEKQKCK